MSKSRVKDIFEAGIRQMLDEDKTEEAGKTGVFRGGSAGIYMPGKKFVAGKCPRLSLLRYKGIKVEDIEPSRKLMFRAGLSNEDMWLETLKKTYTGVIKTEEDIPTKWTTSKGIDVTGRPDIVLGSGTEEDFIPEVGIELKLVSSVWTARDVLFESRPKFDHLIQAAHYSWQLQIPFELWYTSRADYATNDMVTRVLPNYGTPKWHQLSQHMAVGHYRMVRSKAGNMYKRRIKEEEFMQELARGNYGYREGCVLAEPLKILPFAIGFTLDWTEDGRLRYTSTETGESGVTIITQENIEAYYEFLGTMEDTDTLGPRPTELKGDGSVANFTKCQYCPLEKVCDRSEKKGLTQWLDDVKRELSLKKST